MCAQSFIFSSKTKSVKIRKAYSRTKTSDEMINPFHHFKFDNLRLIY